jgi:transcription-repair coupling factor (superfamily II helicase)
MVPSLERLPPDARQRLEAIQRYSELGSGFHVASQDLEIRGAGEILGSRQSGQIQAVGFEAYSRILGEAVAELKGHQIVRESDPDIAFDVPSFLPDDYIEDVGMRLELYRRLAAAPTADDVDAIVDEIGDRFGDPPPEGQHLGHVMACKTYGRQLRALALELRGDRFVVRLGDGTPLEPRLALRLAERTAGRMKLVTNDRIVVLLGAGRESIQRLRACRLALSELVALARP